MSAEPSTKPQAPLAVGAIEGEVAIRLLAGHNLERAQLRIRRLEWSEALAADAARYVPILQGLGRLEHSPSSIRGNQGENLWMGTSGAFSPEHMIAGWASEQRLFRPGRFPNVSTSGESRDVAHYTQMIWPATRSMGCAMGTGGRWDYLVCRYAPPGNIIGQQVP